MHCSIYTVAELISYYKFLSFFIKHEVKLFVEIFKINFEQLKEWCILSW